MLLEKIVIEGIMPERALSKLQREGICVYHAKKLKKNQILLSVKKKDTEKVFAICPNVCYNVSVYSPYTAKRVGSEGLFAVPSLDEQTLDDWWKYAQQVSAELVKPDENHDFSLLSVILAAGETDKSVLKKLKKLSDERKYQSGKHGWSSIRLAVVDLDTHKVHTNRMGDSLKNILQPLV